jgi:hypothetical protein
MKVIPNPNQSLRNCTYALRLAKLAVFGADLVDLEVPLD